MKSSIQGGKEDLSRACHLRRRQQQQDRTTSSTLNPHFSSRRRQIPSSTSRRLLLLVCVVVHLLVCPIMMIHASASCASSSNGKLLRRVLSSHYKRLPTLAFIHHRHITTAKSTTTIGGSGRIQVIQQEKHELLSTLAATTRFKTFRASPTLATQGQSQLNYYQLSRTMLQSTSSSSSSPSHDTKGAHQEPPNTQPLYVEEGIFVVYKPYNWTSQDVVSNIKFKIMNDAKRRGLKDTRKRKKKPWIKIGHGGTLDPLATGILVIGVGNNGTKQLQQYLTGPKGYIATVELGFQTNTLDLDGTIIDKQPYDHVTSYEQIESILNQFRGEIQQVPPIFRYENVVLVITNSVFSCLLWLVFMDSKECGIVLTKKFLLMSFVICEKWKVR